MHFSPDIVGVTSMTNTYHAALAIKAMETGHHVLVEKPMALSLKEADEVVATIPPLK